MALHMYSSPTPCRCGTTQKNSRDTNEITLAHGLESLTQKSKASVAEQLSSKAETMLVAPSQDDSFGRLLRETCEQLDTWQTQMSRAGSQCERYVSFVAQVLECDLPVKLLACLEHLEFEARKAAARILSEVLSGAAGTGGRLAEYARSAPKLAEGLLASCVQQDVFFLGSQIVRTATRCPELVSALLEDGFALRLLDLCFHQGFEISNEVFSSLRDLLLNQKRLAAGDLDKNFEEFCKLYHPLLQREKDYVLQRQALKLLGQLLLDGDFQCVMMRYVQNEQFLQIHMKLLLDDSQTIPLDAFHIFKIFVANPKKPRSVRTILCRNGKRLVKLLETFRHRQNDDNFGRDLDSVLNMLESLSAQ